MITTVPNPTIIAATAIRSLDIAAASAIINLNLVVALVGFEPALKHTFNKMQSGGKQFYRY